MSVIEIGELYSVKEFFWLLYPTKELARQWWRGPQPYTPEVGNAYQNAKRLSECYNCNVCVIEPYTYVVLLEVDAGYFKLLDSNGKLGWICSSDFSKHFELVKE